MEDSFFGFNSSSPLEDDRGGRLGQNGLEEGSEDEYDALNDETFGSAINGDWEDIHENLVRLDGLKGAKNFKDDDENSDLEINFSGVKLDDVDLGSDDNESRITLDPKVWEHPKAWDKPAASNLSKPQITNSSQNVYVNPEAYLRQHFSNPFENIARRNHSNQFGDLSDSGRSASTPTLPRTPSLPGLPPKICTVDDIERNIRNQQQQQLQQQTKQQIDQQQFRHIQQQQQQHLQNQHQQQQQQQQQFQQQLRPPTPKPKLPAPTPTFTAPRPNLNFSSHPLNTPHRVPPGFPPMPMMGNHHLPGLQHHINYFRPMPPNISLALQNYTAHPNFPYGKSINPQLQPPRLPPHLAMMNQNTPNSAHMYNQRLLQQIQQNHPMLPNFNRGFNNHKNHMMKNNGNNMMPLNYYHQNQHRMNMKQNLRSNGNLPEEYDEYANLMSSRDKHWLITIQISQLHTETPYIDDYYYTVFKERRATLNGEKENKAHKDNQLNHPLTQPKGHAQLVLISMGKNGTNVRNGQNRERKTSESKNDKEQTPRTFTPLQFENSLGKFQYGSVTAPRKLIDMDIMGTDSSPQFNTNVELSAQRKSRQLLMNIETMYRIVLKLEDLQNPAAIAAQLALKEKFEDQQRLSKAVSTEVNGSGATSVNSSMSDKQGFEMESREKLLSKLLAYLTVDKIVGMMNVRKGKTLIRRIMPHLEEDPIRWNIWAAVFSSLQSVLKKDKDDTDSVLFSIYPEFKKHLTNAELVDIIKVATAIPLNDKKMTSFFTSKFCLSSLVAILLRAEDIYVEKEISDELNEKYSQFLSTLATSLNRTIQNQTISAAIESDAIKPMVTHLSRFKQLNLDSLMALFSQAKQQLE